MVLFNYSTKEITAKIVYYGPGLCGKTTNLQFVYDNLPQAINKGKMLSLATKTDRTLFFDFLPIDLGTIRGMRTRLQLYTVPGQVFYNTTRKLVLKGADGVVFVADSQKRMIDANLESFKNLEENLAEHDMKLAEMPLIVQFNKRDLPDVAGVEELNAAINKYNAPIYEAVATTGIGVHETLKAITRLVLNSLKERYADKREQRAAPPPGLAAAMASAQARAQTAAPIARVAQAVAPPPPAPTAPPSARPAVQAPVEASRPSMPPPRPSEPVEIAPPEEAPTLDFALPDLEVVEEIEISAPAIPEGAPFEPTGSAPASEVTAEERFTLEQEEPFELHAGPDSGTGPFSGGTDAGPIQELPDQESSLELEMAGEDVLELVDEEPATEAATIEPVFEEESPLLDVTEELLPAEEPLPLDPAPVEIAGSDSLPEMEPLPGEIDSMDVDLLETPELAPGTASAKMAAFFDSALPLGDARAIEPVSRQGDMEALVAEAPRDEAFGWGPPSERGAPEFPLVDEGPVPPPMGARPSDSRDTPMIPFTPIPPAQERPAVVRSISPSELLAREIHLPIRLEIGGQTISFELKISLDLAAAAGRRPSPGGGGEVS